MLDAALAGRRALLTRRAAAVAGALLVALAAFQLALALGAPWGRAAYGGFAERPGPELRASSAVAVVLWTCAALVVLRRGGYDVRAPVPQRWLPGATWVVFGLLTAGVLVNVASPSPLERAIWIPATLAMAISTFLVATRPRPRTPSAPCDDRPCDTA